VRSGTKYIEAQFEKQMCEHLEEVLGVFNYHTAERFYMGIPDRYCQGGRWVEFKVVNWSGTKPVSPIRQFKAHQIETLDRFHRGGDKIYVAILFQTVAGVRHALVWPWPKFRSLKPQWTTTDVLSRTRVYENDPHTHWPEAFHGRA
jgi:hypothetical protein